MRRNGFLFVLLVVLFVAGGFLVQSKRRPFHERLVSKNDTTRNLAYYYLRRKSEKNRRALLNPLAGRLRDVDPTVRRFALYALRLVGVSGPAEWEKVLPLLNDSDPSVRKEALNFSISQGPAIIPLLMNELPDLSRTMRERATRGIAAGGEDAAVQLIPFLSADNVVIRRSAVTTLFYTGRQAEAALPAVNGLVKDSDPAVRMMAALTISNVDPDRISILPVFKETLKKKDWTWVQYEILKRVATFGKKAKSVAPILAGVIRSREDGYEDGPYPLPESARTLAAIDPRSVRPAGLRWDLRQRNFVTRYRAVWQIGRPAQPDRGFVPDLVGVLNGPVDPVSARALYALGKIGLNKTARFNDRISAYLLSSFEKGAKPKRVVGYYSMAGSVWAQRDNKALTPLIQGFQDHRFETDTIKELLNAIKPAFLRPLEAYLNYSDPTLQTLAAYHLVRAGYPSERALAILKSAGLQPPDDGEKASGRPVGIFPVGKK